MSVSAFQQLHDALPEPTLLLSGDGQILAANRAAYELVQSDRGAYLDRARLHDIVSDPPHKLDTFLQLCRRSRDLMPGALTVRTATSDEVTCRAEGALVNLGSPGILLRLTPRRATISRFDTLNERIDAQNREILRRREAEASLYAEREWLRTTLASIGDAVIATDTEGRVTFINAVAEALTGWPQGEASGLPLDEVFQIVNEYSRTPVSSPVAAVLRHGLTVGLANHTLLLARDGSERPIADSSAPIRSEDGTLLGVVLVFRDLTDTQLAQNRVAASEARYRRIFESARVAIFEQDFSAVVRAIRELGIADIRSYCEAHPEFVREAAARVRLLDVNAAAVELFGALTKQDLLESLFRIFVPRTEAVFLEEIVAIAEGRHTFESEAPLVKLDGTPLQVLFTMSFPTDDPDLRNVLVSLMDITDRKRFEEKLQRANADLERFAYAAAHDLQEPLRNVVLYTQMLERKYGGVLDAVGRDHCKVAIEGGRRMQSLVQGLLEYTRVVAESDAPVDNDAPVSVAAVLADVQANLASAIAESGATIEVHAVPHVRVHRPHVVQIFQNLIGNAIKYRSSERAPLIRITAEHHGATRHVFSVADNGIGIRPEYRERIFEAFRRLHGREIPGAGMGLTIASRLVNHYGGQIWVDSEERRGSSFRFTLPTA
jgi:PAS domain S-box-containing protein